MNSLDHSGAETDPIRCSVAAANKAGLFKGWDIASSKAHYAFWSEYRPLHSDLPDTGIKIHVSASLATAAPVLTSLLPILVARRVPFKHAASLQELAFLSSGRGGLTQIGKFLAIYPSNPDAAAELAQVLHDATSGFAGPCIRSESAFADNSLVHYRYGGFARKSLQLLTGRVVPARVGAGGVLKPDDRGETKSLPAMHKLAIQNRVSPAPHLLSDRYVRIQPLHQGPKGTTWLGFDTAGREDDLVVIKEAYAYVMEASDGLDARGRLRQEADCLAGLSATGLVPDFLAFWEEGRSAFLVYEFIDGRPFDYILNALAAEGLRPTATLMHDWTEKLCKLVSGVHHHGYIIGDLKPANLILTDYGFRLIDLELAARQDESSRGGMGTRGYASPQQSDKNKAHSCQDDVFSLGATMLAAAIAMDCSMLPASPVVAQLERRRDPLNQFYPVIETCLAPERAERFDSADSVLEALRTARKPGTALPAECALQDGDFLQFATDIGDLLLNSAVREGAYAWWSSPHPVVGNVPIRDLYAGSAGTALFLCALYRETRDRRFLDIALQCASWLHTTEPVVPVEGDMPGLYFGICGSGLLFLRLHELTGDARWLDRALEVGEHSARMVAHSPDIMTGRAGTGLFQLALWKVLGHSPSLHRAVHEANSLLHCRSADQPTWIIPPAHETLSGNAYIGFAHGSAGIGYFLSECALACKDAEMYRACSSLADWIIDIGRPCLSDGSGLSWGAMEKDNPTAVNWCHGATGITRFLLKVHELTGHAAHLNATYRAARMIAHTSWHGTTLCHGLAGNADVLVDVWRQSGDDTHLEAAKRLGENLAAFRTEEGWPSEELSTVCPDLMIGQAGVGAAYLRLARPDLPHLISI